MAKKSPSLYARAFLLLAYFGLVKTGRVQFGPTNSCFTLKIIGLFFTIRASDRTIGYKPEAPENEFMFSKICKPRHSDWQFV